MKASHRPEGDSAGPFSSNCVFASGTDLLRAMRKANVEYEALLEGLLTQETSFFRYPAVYETFEKRVLPELHVKKFWKNPRTLRVWSAGCSTGEEPYSIAITIADALSFSDAWNVEILATDVGRQALKHAERGIYSGRSLGSVTPAQLSSHFATVEGGHQIDNDAWCRRRRPLQRHRRLCRDHTEATDVWLCYRAYRTRLLCAVIHSAAGSLLTAYPTDAVKPGERIWIPSE